MFRSPGLIKHSIWMASSHKAIKPYVVKHYVLDLYFVKGLKFKDEIFSYQLKFFKASEEY